MTGSAHQSLNGAWQFQAIGSQEWLPGTVPGGVHTDLLRAGRIHDPFVGDEEKRTLWIAERDWVYRRDFVVEAALLDMAQIFLICDGLDTLAELWLNGQRLGSADNMFRQYRWDVRTLLRSGPNEIRVVLRSATVYAAERQRQRPMIEVNDPLPGAPYLRKAPSHFGWDWGPKLAPVGIWRDIRLESYASARIDELHLRQHHDQRHVSLTAMIITQQWDNAPLSASLRVIAPNGQVQTVAADLNTGRGTLTLMIEQPQLWWPHSYGAQPLYQVEITLTSGETRLDQRNMQIGLRTIELRQERDQWGRSFLFVVNKVPIFAQGSNWIPADSFPSRISRDQLDHLLGSAVAAHHNMIRVWGGGYYEDEHFYDLCDRLGLLVWQDCMFSCATYPLNDAALLATIKIELRQAIQRLRHRACLALWCGNNEIETAWVHWDGWSAPEVADLKAAYDQFFHRTLPEWIADDDPDHAYWPSSPSSGTPFDDPNGGAVGDMHEWTVWHAMMPLHHYRNISARFISEFGFQSLPTLPTIAHYAAPADWNMTSYIMEHHQRNPAGNGKIMVYLTDHLRLPKDFPALVYLSQVLQGEAMRIGVEHWRRDPACSGVLYWQLNDCWPVASWASIDYFGRWKAAHYASRRFFAPLLLSIADHGEHMPVFVTNDTLATWNGQLRWSLETLDGEQLRGDALDLQIAPQTSACVQELDFTGTIGDDQRRRTILVCELWHNNKCVTRAVATFARNKHLALVAPQINIAFQQTNQQLTLRLQSQSLARFVELTVDGADILWDDNYVDLPAGRPLDVTCTLPDGWTTAQFEQALRVRSLFDSY